MPASAEPCQHLTDPASNGLTLPASFEPRFRGTRRRKKLQRGRNHHEPTNATIWSRDPPEGLGAGIARSAPPGCRQA
ncbi:hypothetical protein N9L68_07810 [bacterium]|nr:hypothetical protein [bacterium]